RFLQELQRAFSSQRLVRPSAHHDKHAEVLVGDQEHAAGLGVFNQNRVVLVALNKVVPRGVEVDEHRMFVQRAESFRGDLKGLSNSAMRTVSADEKLRLDNARVSRELILNDGRDALLILREVDQLGRIAEVGAAGAS